MNDTLVTVEDVSKKFCRSLKRSLWYGLRDLGSEFAGRRRSHRERLRTDEFWAVRNVGFSLARGECVGLIGHNGSGKTTLLRMLNGLVQPDAGRIALRGRVGALIALGAGFNPVLSGRENIFVNAAVLGLGRAEVARRFDEIVEFSGLAEFIDAPVQHYSSGMYVRLGFSIAAHVEPDVLLVDEALAVGDLAFVIKCMNKVAELRRNGTGVIFVSHNELQMRAAANRCVVLDHGRMLGDVDVEAAFRLYAEARANRPFAMTPAIGFAHEGPLRLEALAADSTYPPTALAPLRLLLRGLAERDADGVSLELRIWNADGQVVTAIDSGGQGQLLDLAPGRFELEVDIDALSLAPGPYRIAGGFRRNGEVLGWVRDLAHIDVAAPPGMKVAAGVCVTPARIAIRHDGAAREASA
ncbi:MAG: ABC transporter ATP-binding protein [Gammaproteobacteria bacterium]